MNRMWRTSLEAYSCRPALWNTSTRLPLSVVITVLSPSARLSSNSHSLASSPELLPASVLLYAALS